MGIIATGLLFAEMRKYKFMTLSEEIACYYGGNTLLYNLSSVMLFLSKVCWLTVQVTGGALIINLITGIELKLCIVIAGVLMGVTAIPGGLLTVVYTDIVQACILLAGFIVLTIVALEGVDGFAGLKASVPAGYFSFFGVEILGWKKVISLFFVLVVSMISDTNNRHRIYSSISEKTAKWSLVAARNHGHVRFRPQSKDRSAGSSHSLVDYRGASDLGGGRGGGRDQRGHLLIWRL